MKHESRVYPTCCRSGVCPSPECKGCRYEPILREFKEWVARTEAKVADTIWSPTIYVATKNP